MLDEKLTYEVAVELSKNGSLRCISELLDYYLKGDKNERKIASNTLRKTRNKKGVSRVIDEKTNWPFRNR